MALRWSAPTRRMHRGMTALMLAAGALVAALAMSGCAGNGVANRTYWNDPHRWEIDAHRPRTDFRRQDPGDTGGLLGLAPPVVGI